MSRVALVTGAATGLGRETCRQLIEQGWTVVLTARDLDQAEQVAGELGAVGLKLDVTREEDAAACVSEVSERFGRLDALVHSAGVILDDHGDPSAERVRPETVASTMDVNLLGSIRVVQAFLPLLKASGGNIVNVSSGMGALSDMGPGYGAYRMSKAALNAWTVVLDHELRGAVRVNSVCPGWVRTALGGAGAPREVEEGVRGIVWAATLGPGGPSGGFFRDGEPIAW